MLFLFMENFYPSSTPQNWNVFPSILRKSNTKEKEKFYLKFIISWYHTEKLRYCFGKAISIFQEPTISELEKSMEVIWETSFPKQESSL